MSQARGPLEGLKIIDLTRLAPGPYATMLLGDLGATVITVEPPPARRKGASASDIPVYGTDVARKAGLNPLFRSRRSIVIDLKKVRGKDILLELAHDADVFLEGFRPGVVHRLGIDYDSVRRVCPEIVYCSISGYGQEDERRSRSGHDITYLAESGLLSATCRDQIRPGIPLNVAGDLAAGGLIAAFGILAAIRGRERSGEGSFVDVSILHGLLSLLAPTAAWERAGAGTQSWGRGMLTGAAPFYDCYATADGQWIAIAANEAKFYREMCSALGLEELVDAQGDLERWPELRAALDAVFATKERAEWMQFLDRFDFPFAAVQSIEEAFDAELGTSGAATPEAPTVFVPRLSAWAHESRPIARHPGQDTVEILSELGLPTEEIDDLLREGVVLCSTAEDLTREEH